VQLKELFTAAAVNFTNYASLLTGTEATSKGQQKPTPYYGMRYPHKIIPVQRDNRRCVHIKTTINCYSSEVWFCCNLFEAPVTGKVVLVGNGPAVDAAACLLENVMYE